MDIQPPGELVRRHREWAGIRSRKALADLTKINFFRITRIETGEGATISVPEATAICAAIPTLTMRMLEDAYQAHAKPAKDGE